MNVDHWISHIVIADLPYEEAVTGSVWYEHGSDWERVRYLTDEEATALSGVPERSLRTLQTAMIAEATRAPLQAGGHKRVWHLPEVVAAAVVENFKMASGLNYKEAAALLRPATIFIKSAFLDYCNLPDLTGKYRDYSIELIVADHNKIFGRYSDLVRSNVSAQLQRPDRDGISVIGFKDSKDIWRAVDTVETPKIHEQLRKNYDASNFMTVIRLSTIFRRLEIKSQKLRT